jgi:DeoR-like helix-turn-helix domain
MERQAGEIEALFMRGRVADVIACTVDRPGFAAEAESQAGHVVAALAAVGRLDDAHALLQRVRSLTSPRELCVARFFLAVALCRAGEFARAQRLFADNFRAHRAARDGAELAFYAMQGFACFRYFTGRMHKAERWARRALAAAFAADSALGRLLATDLQGHATVQLGEVRRGLALLGRAEALAEAFGFDTHRAAIHFAVTTYEARFGAAQLHAALASLERLESEQVQDSYSGRLVALDRALLLGLAGRGHEARALLATLERALVPEGDRRMDIRTLATRAVLAALCEGEAAARALVAAGEQRLVEPWDLALRVELSCTKAWCAAPGERRALARELSALARTTGIARAALFAHLLEPSHALPASVGLRDHEDDRVGALLLSVLHEQQVPRLLREGYLGLLPRALGLAPGRRVYVIEPAQLIVESHGEVRYERPGDTTVRLLRVLSDGRWWSKEALLGSVWGIQAYRPDRHDSVLYMAIARTRQALGRERDWLENEQGAYRLSGLECRVLPWRDEVHGFELRPPPASEQPEEPHAEPERVDGEPAARALAFVRAEGHTTTGALARSLGVSEMTALRELQRLVASGVLTRVGRGRATRYELSEVGCDEP